MPIDKPIKSPEELAADILDQRYSVADLRAENIGAETPKRGNPMNSVTLPLLRRRCLEAKDAGSVNIAVDVNVLIELLNGTIQACKGGFEPKVTI